MPRHARIALFLALLWTTTTVVSSLASSVPPSRDAWIELETPSFVLFSSSSRGLTRHLAHDLEQLRSALSQIAPFALEAPRPTYVYLFASDRRFEPYKPLYRGRPQDVAGYFVGHDEANYIALNSDPAASPTETVYHEYVHYVLDNNFHHRLPLWLNEGLAEYYSTFLVDGNLQSKHRVAKIGFPVIRHVKLLRGSRLIALRELFAIDEDSPVYNEGERRSIFYAQSWGLVHYFMSDPERTRQLQRYLKLVEEGTRRKKAFAEAFSMNEDDLLRRFEGYVRQRLWLTTDWKIKPLGESAFRERPLGRSEVLFRLGDLLAHQGDNKRHDDQLASAAEHFQAALAEDAKNGRAMAGLGLVEEKRQHPARALAWYEKAMATANDDDVARYYFGRLLLHEKGENDAAARERGLAALRRVNELKPEFGPAWMERAYGLTLRGEGEVGGDDEAVAVGERAMSLLPAREGVAENLLLIYTLNGRRAAARQLYEDFFLLLDDEKRQAWARNALLTMERNRAAAMVNAGRYEEALALFEAVLRQAEGSSDRREIDSDVRRLREVVTHNRFVEQYNEAVRLANTGDVEGAKQILWKLAKEHDGERAKEARELLEKLLRR